MNRKLDNNQIINVKTSQVEKLQNIVSSCFCPIKISVATSEKWSGILKAWKLSQLYLLQAEFPQGAIVTAQPFENDFLLEIPFSGKLNIGYQNKLMPFYYNSSYLMTSKESLLYKYGENAGHISVRIAHNLLQSYALKLINHQSDQQFKIQSRALLTSKESLAVRNYLVFLAHQLNTGEGAIFQSPLIATEIQNTILSMLISISDNNYIPLESQQEESCLPRYVRVATDYIDAHLSEPISIADLASITGVHARTLTNGFKKHYNISPLAYLKHKRLEAVRRDLSEADPETSLVTDIAIKWGFHHLSRFAQDYRNHFGELPSETLKKELFSSYR